MKVMKSMVAAFALGLAIPAVAAASIAKSPNLGPFWNPLSPVGTYVYADSFVVPPEGAHVIALATWLMIDPVGGGGPSGQSTLAIGQPDIPQGTGASSVRFEIWGVAGGGGPDAANILASTGSVTPTVTSSLTYFEVPLATPVNLVPGQEYFFVATCVGESGTTLWKLGAHQQNSTYQDNGTFWYSNDPAGINFDGQNRTPEMAFAVIFGNEFAAIPALGTLGLVLLAGAIALAAIWTLRRA